MSTTEIITSASRVEELTVARPDDTEFWQSIADEDHGEGGALSGGLHALVLGDMDDALVMTGTLAQLEDVALRVLLRVRQARVAAARSAQPPAAEAGWVPEWLHSGSRLRRGGDLPAGSVGFRLPGDVEVTGSVADLAKLGDAISERFHSERAASIDDMASVLGNLNADAGLGFAAFMCQEADALATALAVHGHHDAAVNVILGHCYDDDLSDEHGYITALCGPTGDTTAAQREAAEVYVRRLVGDREAQPAGAHHKRAELHRLLTVPSGAGHGNEEATAARIWQLRQELGEARDERA